MHERESVFDVLDSGVGIGVDTFQNNSCDYFPESYGLVSRIADRDGRGTLADSAAESDPRHIAHAYDGAVGCFDWRVGNIFEAFVAGPHPADAADHELFGTSVLIPAARISVVALQRVADIADGQTIGEEFRGIEIDLVLAHVAAEGKNVGNAVGGLQQ